MFRKISAVIFAGLMCSGMAASAETIQIANGSFFRDMVPYTDFSEENWNGWQREYFFWGEIDDGKMVLTSNNPKTLMPTSASAMAEGRAVRQRSVPINEVVTDYSSNYGDYTLLIKGTLGMPELSDVKGENDGTYDCTDKKSYAEIAFGAYDPWNPAVVTRLVRLVKDDSAETFSVYINQDSDGRTVPGEKVRKGVSGTIDVLALVSNNTVKYFIDGKYCGQNVFASNTPSEAYDVGFYCVGGDEADPITLTVDDAQISVYQACTDVYRGEDDDTVEYSFDMENGLVISFFGSMKNEKIGENVTLSVSTSDTTEIAAGTSCLGENGYFEVSADIPLTAKAETHTYKLTLDNGKVVSGTFEMPDYNALYTMLVNISNCTSAEEIENILKNGNNICAGTEILEQIYPIMDKGFAAQKLYELLKANSLPKNVADFVDAVKEYTVISAFNQSLDDFASDIITKLASLFGATEECINYYTASLTQTGINNVEKNMQGQGFDSYADVEESYRHLVYTNYITNNADIGAGERAAIIENASYTLGLTLTNTSETVISALANSGAATPEALMTVYTEITAPSQSTGGGGGGGGGSYVPPVTLPENTSEEKLYFNDLGNFKWAAEAINFLVENNIVFGKSEGYFNPQDNIKREEAIAILMRMFDFKSDTDKANPFKDVSDSDWYYESVKAASDNNIVSGITEECMGIGLNVTRQDFLAMLLRAVITESVIDVYSSTDAAVYTDFDDAGEYAKEAIRLFSQLGVINGYEDGSIKPHNSITRAEAAQITYKVYKLKDGNK